MQQESCTSIQGSEHDVFLLGGIAGLRGYAQIEAGREVRLACMTLFRPRQGLWKCVSHPQGFSNGRFVSFEIEMLDTISDSSHP